MAEGVSTPQEIDALWVELWSGNRSGPASMMDAVGLETVALIEQHYIKERGLPAAHVDFLRSYIDAGRLGAKSVKGGLHPTGTTIKAKGEARCWHDNVHAPEKPLSSGRILVGSANGRPLRELVTGLVTPDGIGVSLRAGRIFWTSMGVPSDNDGRVCSCRLDGSDVRDIIPRGRLYFSDREGMRVWRAGFDGSRLELLVQTGDRGREEERADPARWCVGVTVSPATGHFFWTQKGESKASQGRIFLAGIDMPAGADAATRRDVECLFQRLPEPIDLEMDEAHGVLYWTDRGELSDYGLVSRGLHEAIGLSLDLRNRHTYAADLGGTVYVADMDGGHRRKFYDDCRSFAGLTHVPA
ncbi:hypothetical protein CDD83_8303 [Cordyceps sp. RAO-2017]|nr:hypothetical protein CDD83_8303 [Cordyceps sp. RAO-2017]